MKTRTNLLNLRRVVRTLPVATALVGLLMAGLPDRAPAQVNNNWISSGSHYWDEAYWSLGIRPASDQAVNITNATTKTVTIDDWIGRIFSAW